MTSLYHIAIIEGFLANHAGGVPVKVQESLDFLKKNADSSSTSEPLPKKRKRRMSAKTRSRLESALVKAREVRLRNLAAKKAAA